jgi:hypothetical protein
VKLGFQGMLPQKQTIRIDDDALDMRIQLSTITQNFQQLAGKRKLHYSSRNEKVTRNATFPLFSVLLL